MTMPDKQQTGTGRAYSKEEYADLADQMDEGPLFIGKINRDIAKSALRIAANQSDMKAALESGEASLAEILDYRGGAETPLDDDYVMQRANDALVKLRAALSNHGEKQ